MNRKTDTELKPTYFRSSDRFFRVDEQWFIETREGDLGPFRSVEDARRRLHQHICEQESFAEAKKKAEKLRTQPIATDPGIWDRQIDAL
ncbi:MAG: hypothetical protein GKR90_01280 [Pseudomonadales bacterium]|nr:hypothetical protein [Pseudomonadales bacterium]